MHAHTHACTHTHAHTHTHIHTLTHLHARMHARTHARTHTHTWGEGMGDRKKMDLFIMHIVSRRGLEVMYTSICLKLDTQGKEQASVLHCLQ